MAEKHAGGRPTKYNENYHPDLVYWMARSGLTDKEMSAKLDISEVTLNAWKKVHPEFLKSLKAGKDTPDDQVENALLQRALGYSHDEDKIFNNNGFPLVVPTIKHYPPDPTSMIFWLKNRRSGKWRDKQEFEHSGNIAISFDDQDKDL